MLTSSGETSAWRGAALEHKAVVVLLDELVDKVAAPALENHLSHPPTARRWRAQT